MSNVTIVLFVIYQVFYGLLSYYHSVTVKADPIDVAALDAKLWLDNTPLAAAATSFLLVARITGVVFLIYLGFRTEWYFPVILFLGALLAMGIINTIVRRFFGSALPSLASFIVLPIAAVALFLSV